MFSNQNMPCASRPWTTYYRKRFTLLFAVKIFNAVTRNIVSFQVTMTILKCSSLEEIWTCHALFIKYNKQKELKKQKRLFKVYENMKVGRDLRTWPAMRQCILEAFALLAFLFVS